MTSCGVSSWTICVSRQHRLCRRWPGCIFTYYFWKAVVFIHRLWNNVYHRWITNNFPCKWHTNTTNGSKSSSRKIFHRNSSGARTPTSNSAWTTREKTSTRNHGAERTSLSMYSEGNAKNKRQRNRGTGDWNIRGIMIVLHSGKPKFISLPVSPPISLQSFSSLLRPEV